MEETEKVNSEEVPEPVEADTSKDESGAKQSMKVLIRSLEGEIVEVDVEGKNTIADLKGLVKEKIGVEPGLQRLLFGQMSLEDASTIEDCGMKAGSELTLLKDVAPNAATIVATNVVPNVASYQPNVPPVVPNVPPVAPSVPPIPPAIVPPPISLFQPNVAPNVRVPGSEYTVTVERTSNERLGLDVDNEDGKTLLIECVTGGLFKGWNDKYPELAARPGDRIVEVNGIREPLATLVDECKKNKVLTFKVLVGMEPEPQALYAHQAPEQLPNPKMKAAAKKAKKKGGRAPGLEYYITLDRTSGGTLGVDVYHDDGGLLVIDRLTDGLLPRWNDAASPDLAARVGDSIVAVNGVCGQVKMVDEMRKNQVLTLTLKMGAG